MRQFTRVLLVVLVVLVIVVALVAVVIYRQLDKDTPQVKTEGDLAFMSDRAGNWDIVLLDKDANLTNLTATSEGHEFFHNFTFGGTVMNLYSTQTGEVTPGKVNTDGSGFKTMSFIEALGSVITEGLTDWDPAWSPDGERMMWSKVKAGFPPAVDLFVANADGSDERNLTNDSATDMMPAWSPDGSRIAFISDKSGFQNVYVVEVESSTITRLTDHEVSDMEPVWSDDGSRILFVSEQDSPLTSGALQYFVVNPDGSDLHLLGTDEVFKGDLTYSPHGGEVAYMSNEDASWNIYVMDSDGSNVRRLTEGGSNNLFPSWRPVPDEVAASSE